MKPDYTNARSADGPTVVAYLREQLPYLRTTKWEMGARDDWTEFATAVLSWDRADRLVCVYTLDQWLTPRGVTLSELPPECWRWSSPKTRVKDRELAEEVIGKYVDGAGSQASLARAYRLSKHTLNYRRRPARCACHRRRPVRRPSARRTPVDVANTGAGVRPTEG